VVEYLPSKCKVLNQTSVPQEGRKEKEGGKEGRKGGREGGRKAARSQWLTPVILATWKAETGRL
jgi:hypothetical protein